jgi:hypothetical protein
LRHDGFRLYLPASINSSNFSEDGPIALAHAISLGDDALVANEARMKRNVDFSGRFQDKLDILQTTIECETKISVKTPGADFVQIYWHRRMMEKLLEHPADNFQFGAPFRSGCLGLSATRLTECWLLAIS